MKRWRARNLGVAMAFGCGLLASSRMATAFSCVPPRDVTPFTGEVVPSNTLIWDVCYQTQVDVDSSPTELCPPPTLKDSEGHTIELSVEQQVRSASYPRVLTAYRPSEALAVGGTYLLEIEQYGSAYSQQFSVVEPAVESPPLPVISAVDFSVRAVLDGYGAPFNARFTFEPFEGNLIAEPEGVLPTPFEGLDVARPLGPDGERAYFLAKEACYVNFNAADWGATTSVRFGIMDFAGNFSGWTEPTSIEYPLEVTEYPEVVLEREQAHERAFGRSSSACSVTGHAPASQTPRLLFVLVGVVAVRRKGWMV